MATFVKHLWYALVVSALLLAAAEGECLGSGEAESCSADFDKVETKVGNSVFVLDQKAIDALSGTLAITLGGNAVILLFLKFDLPTSVLNLMLAFASGALLGDVFLHLLPHAMEASHSDQSHHHHHHHHNEYHHHHNEHPHDHSEHHHHDHNEHPHHDHNEHPHDHEKHHHHDHNEHPHHDHEKHHHHDHNEHPHDHEKHHHVHEKHHHHDHSEHPHDHSEHPHVHEKHHNEHHHDHSGHHDDDHSGHVHDNTLGLSVLAGIISFFVMEKLLRLFGKQPHSHAHSHKGKGHSDKGKEEVAEERREVLVFGLKPGAILNMTGDALHNFTDGMSIAAAFQISRSLGMTVTLAMLLHEIPHEIGDFAVLVSQGFTKWGAFKAQFVSAVGAFLGCWFGLVVSTSQPMFVLAFTAGGFIYISLCSIFPELLEHTTSFTSLVGQVLSFGLGVYMMVLISEFEAH